MKDIAQDMGVSLMTVSKALRNKSDIAEETRRRIVERARELKYQPNLIARSLVSRRSHLVGLIVPDMMRSFFGEVAKGVSDALEPRGYQIVLCNSGERPETEVQQVKMLLSRYVDGLIVASSAMDAAAPLADVLTAPHTRSVLVDRSVPGVNADYVGVDDQEIASLAVGHLIDQGCRRIAHLRGPDISTGVGRLQGYQRTLAKRRLKAPAEYVRGGAMSDAAGYEAMRELLRQSPRPDGVFGFNDAMAAGAIKAILEAGLRVPEDIAVIGVGNGLYSDLLRVPLSSVDQSSQLVGRTAAELLLGLMECEDEQPAMPRRILLAPRLVVRESTLRKK